MGASRTMNTYALSGMQVCDLSLENVVTLPKLYTVKKLPVSKSLIPTTEDITQWPHLQDIKIPTVKADIGLLIGNNVPDAYSPIEVRSGPENSPHASRTRLGWILWNVIRKSKALMNSVTITTNRINITAIEKANEIDELVTLDRMFRQSFDVDFPERISDTKKEHSQEDKRFLQKLKESIQLIDGHYQIALPFRDPHVKLPNNRTQASHRLLSLRKKMEKNSKFKEDYKAFMKNIFEKGYAERVPDEELHRNDGRVWYIPHHGVYHPKKDKIRVVFDCAAAYQGVSLSKVLLQGPDLMNNILGVLIRFRQESVAIMGDIESMFFQVKIPREDQDCQRFYWWPDGDLCKEPDVCRMLVHLFGAVSSPSCANAALQQTVTDGESDLDPGIVEVLRRNFYVDDCLSSTKSDQEAIQQVKEISAACRKGGFRVAKWISSSHKVLQKIPAEDKAKNIKDLDFEREELPSERALVVFWSVETDTLGFKIHPRHETCTRRGILSTVSSVYDPLGFASPFVLPAKMVLQDLCRQGLGWDEDISNRNMKVWQQWIVDLPELQDIKIPRCYKPTDYGPTASCELHVFSDASDQGYGIAAYLRFTSEKNRPHCTLIIGKARVAPLKKITIPRMELAAACVAVRISHLLIKELQYTVTDTYYWTDSMAVIRYISNETTRFHTFVANRLAVIRDSTSVHQWRYVPTDMNPADASSRGMKLKAFLNADQWFHGPAFLWNSKTHWPTSSIDPSLLEIKEEDDSEVKRTVAVAVIDESADTMNTLLASCSSWMKLKKIVSWYLIIMENLLHRVKRRKMWNSEPATGVQDSTKRADVRQKQRQAIKDAQISLSVKIEPAILEKAEKSLIRYVQKQCFPKEYLSMLQERQKWLHPRKNVSVNDVVLLMDNSPRNSWSLGRVVDVVTDRKGFVRIVKVKTSTTTLVRPVDKLCIILEADDPVT